MAAAKILSKSDKVAVTLLNRSPYHLYHASLYEAATEEVTRKTVTIPLRQIFARSNVVAVTDEIKSVDKAKRRVTTHSGHHYYYDYLVIGLGAVSKDFAIKGVRTHAYMFGELKETLLLKDNLRTTFQMNYEKKGRVVEVVICGGGFSGVELAAELRYHLKKLQRRYPCDTVSLTILEASSQVLPGMPANVVKAATDKLKQLKVTIITSNPVAEVKKDGIRLKSGQWVPSNLTIWTAGTKPNPLPADMHLPLDERGRPVVNESLSVVGHTNIFVAGDLAGYTDPKTGRGIPPQAYNASAMGRVVGKTSCVRSTVYR